MYRIEGLEFRIPISSDCVKLGSWEKLLRSLLFPLTAKCFLSKFQKLTTRFPLHHPVCIGHYFISFNYSLKLLKSFYWVKDYRYLDIVIYYVFTCSRLISSNAMHKLYLYILWTRLIKEKFQILFPFWQVMVWTPIGNFTRFQFCQSILGLINGYLTGKGPHSTNIKR